MMDVKGNPGNAAFLALIAIALKSSFSLLVPVVTTPAIRPSHPVRVIRTRHGIGLSRAGQRTETRFSIALLDHKLSATPLANLVQAGSFTSVSRALYGTIAYVRGTTWSIDATAKEAHFLRSSHRFIVAPFATVLTYIFAAFRHFECLAAGFAYYSYTQLTALYTTVLRFWAAGIPYTLKRFITAFADKLLGRIGPFDAFGHLDLLDRSRSIVVGQPGDRGAGLVGRLASPALALGGIIS